MKTKEILREWNLFLKKDILHEISFKKFQKKYPEFNTSEFTSQLKGNSIYLDIIANSINSGQQHGPDEYIEQFKFYKSSIEQNRNNKDFLTINVPGGDHVSLDGKLNYESCTATYLDIQQFQQARMFILGKGNKKNITSEYEKIINEANQLDFELVAENSDWIIFYPKSPRGSIALARSYWDGEKIVYDKTFQPHNGFGKNTGFMNWCTSVSGDGNMFLNFSRKKNQHLYYCIKKNLTSLKDVDRKLCISFNKEDNIVELALENNSSVNGNNEDTSESDFKRYIGDNLFNILLDDAEKPERLEIDNESFYKSINLTQYKNMRKANENSLEDFTNQIKEIISYSKDKKSIFQLVSQEENINIKIMLSNHPDLLKLDSTSNILKKLALNDNIQIKRNIANRTDLTESNSNYDLVEYLSQDKDFITRFSIACYGPTLSNIQDQSKKEKLFKQLASDKHPGIRKAIARRSDLLELNIDLRNKLINQLAKDEAEGIRDLIASKNYLLEIDPSGKIIKQLANDESSVVRQRIFNIYKKSLLQIDPSGDLFKKLSKEKDEYIKSLRKKRTMNNKNESILKKYIETLIS